LLLDKILHADHSRMVAASNRIANGVYFCFHG
jgi:hypothetical protein